MKNQKIFLIIFIALIIIGAIFYFILNKPSKNNLEVKNENEINWHLYTNNELGFSMNIPEEVSGLYRCSSPISFMVPVKVFDDNKNGIVYIAPEYYYEAKWDSKLVKYVGPCEKINYSVEKLREEALSADLAFPNLNLKTYKPFLGWAAIIKTVNNDNELSNTVKDMFGSGCNYKKESLEQNGVYKISLSEKNKTNLENTACPINFSYKFLYNAANKKILFIKLGQECNFFDDKTNKCYDNEIVNSLKLF